MNWTAQIEPATPAIATALEQLAQRHGITAVEWQYWHGQNKVTFLLDGRYAGISKIEINCAHDTQEAMDQIHFVFNSLAELGKPRT